MHVIRHHHISHEEEFVAFPNLAQSLHKHMARPHRAQQRQSAVTTEGKKMQVAAPVVTFQALGHEKTPTRKTDAWGTLVCYSLWNCRSGMLSRCGTRKKEPNPMTGPPVHPRLLLSLEL